MTTDRRAKARAVYRSIAWPILVGPCCLGFNAPGRGAELGVINNFDDGPQGWLGAEPAQVANGGPAGEGDAFLRIEATGRFGPGSKLAAFNNSASWTGDLAAVGATGVEMDVMNFESTGSELALRFVLFGPSNVDNRWTSSEAVAVPNDGQWHHVLFPIDAGSFTRVAGSATYEQMMADVVRVMIRHNDGQPGAQGTNIAGALGIDNVRLVPEPAGMRLLLGGFAMLSRWFRRRLLTVRTRSIL